MAGMRAGIPAVLGFIPVGIAYAIMARQAGFSVTETIMMSVTVFAGASQMMAVGMYASGAGIAAIIFATFILNFRHLIMSTCIFSRMDRVGIGKKLIAGFGVTDESFAIFTTRKDGESSYSFFLSMTYTTYVSWVAGAVIGVVAANFMPEILSLSFGIALYAMFIGLIVPGIKGNLRLGLLVLLTAGLNTVLSLFLESAHAVIISTLVGAFVGVFFVDPDGKETEGAV